jgi:hypothetical protein
MGSLIEQSIVKVNTRLQMQTEFKAGVANLGSIPSIDIVNLCRWFYNHN